MKASESSLRLTKSSAWLGAAGGVLAGWTALGAEEVGIGSEGDVMGMA